MAKVVCALYDGPVYSYPKSCARDELPNIERFPGGQTLPTPKAIDFKPRAPERTAEETATDFTGRVLSRLEFEFTTLFRGEPR